MAEVKCPETNLNGSKTVRIFEKFSENGEIPLVSDRYDLPSSPKETTRTKKQKSRNPVYYRITWPAKWKTSSCSMELRMHWNNWRLFFYPKQSRGGRQIILHAVDATARGTTGEHSSCHWYRQEPSKNYSLTNFSHLRLRNSSRSPGVSCSKWSRQYWLFFGEGKLHAGKLSAFEGSDLTPGVAIMASIEKFVCQPCLPETDMWSVAKLRWWFFWKKQA